MTVMAWFITRYRRADSPASWWICVVVFTLFGAVLCAFALVGE